MNLLSLDQTSRKQHKILNIQALGEGPQGLCEPAQRGMGLEARGQAKHPILPDHRDLGRDGNATRKRLGLALGMLASQWWQRASLPPGQWVALKGG